jgi:hypothetical protein
VRRPVENRPGSPHARLDHLNAIVPKPNQFRMKNHHHNHPIHVHSATQIAPPHDAVALRAWSLWTGRGQPENQAEAIWLEAEAQLLAAPPIPTT